MFKGGCDALVAATSERAHLLRDTQVECLCRAAAAAAARNSHIPDTAPAREHAQADRHAPVVAHALCWSQRLLAAAGLDAQQQLVAGGGARVAPLGLLRARLGVIHPLPAALWAVRQHTLSERPMPGSSQL